jgi:hypothetical protein
MRLLLAADDTSPTRMRSTITANTRISPNTWRVAEARNVPRTPRMIRYRLVPRMVRIIAEAMVAEAGWRPRAISGAARPMTRG